MELGTMCRLCGVADNVEVMWSYEPIVGRMWSYGPHVGFAELWTTCRLCGVHCMLCEVTDHL